jgi:hypothetical protein
VKIPTDLALEDTRFKEELAGKAQQPSILFVAVDMTQRFGQLLPIFAAMR